MGILEDSIGAVLGRAPGGSSGPSFGGGAYAPLATALIGLLAAKAATGGFGNLGSMFGGGQPAPQAQPQGGYGQQTGAEPQGAGGLLGGLGGLLHHFDQAGMGQVAQSWIGSGANQTPSSGQLTQALGPELIRQLAQKTGMSEEQISQQLSHELPSLVDKLTPQGRLPTHEEASGFLNSRNPLNPS